METYWVNCEKSEANKNFSVRRNRLMVARKKIKDHQKSRVPLSYY